MKKTLLVLTTIILISSACTSLKNIPGYEKLTGLDFRPYAEKGFLITPHAYTGDYISIYMVNYVIMPEANYLSSNSKNAGTGDYTSGYWSFQRINGAEALKNIYQECVEMGADALMDFSVNTHTEEYSNIQNPVTVIGIEIKGIAIKRGN